MKSTTRTRPDISYRRRIRRRRNGRNGRASAGHAGKGLRQGGRDPFVLDARDGKYQGCTFPAYDEIASRRKNYYWAVAGFSVVSEGGTRYMNLTSVSKLTTFVFHINAGRKVWQLDNFDSQMIH